MMMSDKIFTFVVSAVISVLLLTVGCAPPVKEPAETKVGPEREIPEAIVESTKPEEQKPEVVVETVKPEVEPEKQIPTVKLALKFSPQDSTTYKVITEAQKSVSWEGPTSKKPATFQGGHTGNQIEVTFTQKIQSVDDKGNAVAAITIKELKYLAKVKDNPILDFDSSREKDRDNPLAKLIGQSYSIEISPAGRVTKVIDVNEAQAAVEGSSAANKTAVALLSADAIKERHTISALPATDTNQFRPGDNWSNIKTLSFGMMGSKSYEKISTLKEITDADNRQIAIVDMNAIPSSEMAEKLHKEQATSFFSKMFDNTETYTGELKLDLTAGKVEKYTEKLRSEWLAVEPLAGQEGDREPAALKMVATRLYRIEKVD